MYLKRLDLQGFKSFPEKVRLEFNTGITTVVGPNGSGKSNISDAVRWVLGEQKVKSLRGDKMEDVIFAGTENRKPLGFAEVSMTLDNQDGKMPIEYTEVTITRRVFRSGESEYLLNGTSCRLKDIYELFMDTGIGREGYSIIGQGRIDEILSSKSEDRRKLFEEAAGIVKYKNRKNETIAKLEKEQQNLLRVEDIIKELEGQIEPLLQQSETAKQYLVMKEKLKTIEINLFHVEADKMEEELNALQKSKTIVQTNQEAEMIVKEQLKQKSAVLYEKSESLSVQIQAVNEKLIQIRAEIEKKEGEYNLTQEQKQHLQENIERLVHDIEQKREKINKNKEQVHLCQIKLNGVELNKVSEKNKLDKLEQEFNILNNQLSINEEHAEEDKVEMIENIRLSTELKGSISNKHSMLEQLQKRQKQIEGERGYLDSQINAQKTHIQAVEKQAQQCKQGEINCKEEIEKINKTKEQLQEEKELLTKKQIQQEKELNEKKSRFSVLSEMEREYEGFFKSVKSILKLKSRGNKDFLGIHGAVAELLNVDKKFETAIEIALGSALQNIVTETEQDAQKAIQYLKNNHLGRATFLPVSAIKGKEMGQEKERLLKENGVIGVAGDLITYNSKFHSIISSLLGKVIVMEDLESAVVFAKKYKYAYKIVTLDGELLSAGGAMTGGSIAKKAVNLFGRSREIKELKKQLEQETVMLTAIEESLSKKEVILESLRQKIVEKQLEVQQFHMNMLSAVQDKERTIEVLKNQNEKFALYVVEEQQLQEQYEGIEEDAEIDKNKLIEIETKIKQLDYKLSKHQEDAEQERTIREKLLNEITELKINLSNYEQNCVSIHSDMKRISNETISFQEEMKSHEEEIKNYENLKKQKTEELIVIKESIFCFQNNQKEKQSVLLQVTEERKNTTTEVMKIEEKTRENMELLSQLKNELFRIETKNMKLEEEKQKLYDEIWEEYEITYQQSKEYPLHSSSYTQLKKDAKELRIQIKALGSVNVDAIETYKEVKQRYEFLTNQKRDIVEAEKKLNQIVEELSSLMEEQFREQFAVISENFNVVFKEMFGGGKAYLKLSDAENILESSIEIIAQPPGKNLQNMMLLSGGERALTAIAILFSILKMKPSPFCILDEIEAALDDANVRRYAKYLTKFSSDTQFIVITHRKGTMEAADVMYGITMQEKGVSKLVSVNFEETKYA